MSLTFIGRIITEPEIVEAKSSDNKGYKFALRTKEKKPETINCTCWTSSNAGRYADIRLDAELTVRGFYGKSQKTMDGFNVVAEDKNFVVTYFRTKEETEGARAVEIRSAGGEEGYKKSIRDYHAAKQAAGYVRVPLIRDGSSNADGINHWWVKREDAVETSNGWMYWGDFILDILNEEQRKAFIGGLRKFAREFGVFDGRTRNSDGTSAYRTWKIQCIERAKDIYQQGSNKIEQNGARGSSENIQEKTWEQKVAEANII